jgi:FkbM family methyltransferase|tara:strand:+ start:60 stop:938 length:879 start_codon:yes stop_codon:yes gene_type:complete
MFRIFSKLIYKILKLIDNVLIAVTKRSFLIWFKDFLEVDAYKKVKINGYKKKEIKFFTPNYLTNWLVDDFYRKEPETIEWINSFKTSTEEIIFWDIGANLGLYSIYAAAKYDKIKVISFEPSTSNLRILSRNISINNLQDKIMINQLPLGNKSFNFSPFRERKFGEGESNNSFNSQTNFEGKHLNSENSYKLLGTSINSLLEQKILEIPNYIKIDVDGLEHFILEGASNYLNHPNIKSLQIELNENYINQFEAVKKITKDNGFKFKFKKRNEDLEIYKNKDFSKIYNYYYER